MQPSKTFKIVLIGDSKVGKTTFLHRFQTGNFKYPYNPTVCVGIENVNLDTNYGKYTLQVWDCAGKEENSGLHEGYFQDANGAIIMFDVTFRPSFDSAEKWMREFYRANSNNKDVPLVICGNKIDTETNYENRVFTPTEIRQKFTLSEKIKYYDISAKSCYNFEKAFLSLLRNLTGHEDLVFVEKEV